MKECRMTPAVRALFPGTAGRAFLDSACIGLMPTRAGEALTQLNADLLSCPARDTSSHRAALDRTAHPARRAIAKLINADHHDIALVESTTHALQIVASAVPLSPGDRVLVGETEYLGVAIPWIGKRATDGFEIVTVPHRAGRLVIDDFLAAIDGRSRMILLSSVQWNNGFRVDLAAFSDVCRSRGIVLVVDAIQQLGCVPIDVQSTPCDFLVCGGHKWLCAPAGRGFLYASPDRQRSAAPSRGYMSVVTPPQGWAEYFATPSIPAVRDYDFHADARAFEVGGTGNYPGNVVLAASVALLNEVGPAAIARHSLELGDELIAGLEALGATVVSPRRPEERSGIVSFTLGHEVERDRAMLQRLWDAGVIISHRYTANVGGLRVSLHLFNDRSDVARLLDAVRDGK
jgi:cysteine desulfurase/selenocysteine lyase